jgi:hypothetical protein
MTGSARRGAPSLSDEAAGSSLPPHLSALPVACDLQGITPYETGLLLGYLEQARAYAETLAGYVEVRQVRFAAGFGGVMGIFLMEMDRNAGPREWRWIVVGNPPSAHFALSEAGSPRAALERYCELGEAWVDAIRRGESVQEIPLAAAPSPEIAGGLASKLQTLRRIVLPALFLAGANAPGAAGRSGVKEWERR